MPSLLPSLSLSTIFNLNSLVQSLPPTKEAGQYHSAGKLVGTVTAAVLCRILSVER